MTIDLQALPEECIAHVISLTTPPEACRFSLLSKMIKSAAESDAVWDNFFPPETHTILAQSNSHLSRSYNSKKELYLALSDHPVLFDDGNMSFSLEKCSGKKCYMVAAKRLRIAWGDTPTYWDWISLPESRFEEVAHLKGVGWFEIRGRIATSILSPSTLYKAYLVYKFKLDAYNQGFEHHPTTVTVRARVHGFDYECPNLSTILEEDALERNAFLAGAKREVSGARFPEVRADGWLEMELGETFCEGEEDGELEMICCEINNSGKSGIIVQGIDRGQTQEELASYNCHPSPIGKKVSIW